MSKNNNILVEASTLYDFDIGIIHMIGDSKFSKGIRATLYDNSTEAVEASLSSMKLLQIFKFEKIDELFSTSFYPDFYKDFDRDAIYDAVFDKYTKACMVCSRKTAMVKFINACMASDSNIGVTIICRNDTQVDMIKSECPNAKFIVCTDRKDIDLENFSRIFIRNLEELDHYPDIRGMNILVQDYRSNFNSDEKMQLLPDYIINYGDANEFEIVNTYVGLQRPMG